ncbi:response regulator transcription factor [Stenotrophomonas sp. SAM-B]|uniref:response regulator transcription factor n=1 Tax=Stenotrophomonas sp. SAM-B TaxID=2729141 RepID=UPI0015A1F1A1|nr:response regulator transcription factor [Stenotrophomonas sp. SAM-B]NWF32594.1 response regulator transcription factor [Stenotrophomonas sp. SAM-B]
MKRILIADDHPVIRIGLHAILSRDARYAVVGEATDAEQLEVLLSQRLCDLVITDLSMPRGRRPDGVRMVAGIRREFPDVRVLVVTSFSNPEVLRAIAKLGVGGILEKTSALSVLIEAVQTILAGGNYYSADIARRLQTSAHCANRLTARESEVVRLLAHGMEINEIAQFHRRTVSTISRQKCAAMKRLGFMTEFELMDYARRVGLSPTCG